ncbi:MAG: ABC transporter substrate-binding protein [Pseudomonadota bacterium]
MVSYEQRLGRQELAGRSSAFTRRSLMRAFASVAGASLLGSSAACASSPPLVVTLNGALTETVVALGVERFGAAALSGFKPPPGLSPVPAGAFDVGTQSEPNIELLVQERPAMFLHSPEWPPDPSVLRRLAPVVNVPIYVENGDPYTEAGRALDRIGELVERTDAARRYRAHVDHVMEATREAVRPYRDLHFLLMNSPGPRTMGSAGQGSLFGGVLRELGLTNAISEHGNFWGLAMVEMRQLLAMDGVWAVHIGPLPERLKTNPFWQALPFITAGRFVEIPEIWQWGGLPSAVALASAMSDAIGTIDHGTRG